MKNIKYVMIACLAVLYGLSCYSSAPTLTGSFTCGFLDGKPLIPGSRITLIISENRIQGNGGCNGYYASFNQKGTSINIGTITSSTMACPTPAGVLQQEALYFQLLSQAGEISNKGNSVELMGNARVLMVFSPSP